MGGIAFQSIKGNATEFCDEGVTRRKGPDLIRNSIVIICETLPIWESNMNLALVQLSDWPLL